MEDEVIETPPVSEDEGTPAVEITLNEAPEAVEDPPVIVVVEDAPNEGGMGIPAAVVEFMVNTGERLAGIETRLSGVEGVAANAEVTSDIALEQSAGAVEAVVESTESEATDEAESDSAPAQPVEAETEPQRDHPFFRPRRR